MKHLTTIIIIMIMIIIYSFYLFISPVCTTEVKDETNFQIDKSTEVKDETNFQIGKSYEITFVSDNPFEKTYLDTILIKDIKSGYILYIKNNKYEHSREIKSYENRFYNIIELGESNGK